MLSFCSPFYKNIGYFGEYPSEEQFQELVDENFVYFIDFVIVSDI